MRKHMSVVLAAGVVVIGLAASPYFKPLGLALLLAVPSDMAWAHSLEDLERLMGDRERYFQAMDKVAPDFALQDADGRPVSLADLGGKVVVLHFIYAACSDVCPLHAVLIAETQGMVNQTPMKEQVQFITITTDPENDTPDVLRAYGELRGLDSENWTFLTTREGLPEDATRRLAGRFGHKFVKMDDGHQVHGIVTHVIDQDGHWRANFHGLRFESVNLVLFVNALINEVHWPHAHELPRVEQPSSIWEQIKRWLGF